MPMAKETLYIIDGHAHIYAAYYAPMRGALRSPGGRPTKASYIFTQAIAGLVERKKPEYIVVVMDAKEPSFRSEMYAEYKAHRPPMPEDLPGQIEDIEKILDAMRIPVLRVPGYEADDLIGTLCRKAREEGLEACICSKDKDMLQLLEDGVYCYDIKKDKRFDEARLKEDMGVRPEQFIDVLALQGDTSDNVPGVPDVGPKTALAWIQEYGSLDALYEHADDIGGKRGKNLREFKEQAYLSQKLVTICREAPVDIDRENMKLDNVDKEKLASIFTELGFTRLMDSFGLHAASEKGDSPKASPDGYQTIRTVKKDYRLVDSKETFETFVGELKKQKRFAVDTETTGYDAMRCELVGLSFSWEKDTGYYLSVRGPLGGKCLDIAMVREQLGPILADEKIEKIGQNIKYDMLVLANAKMPLAGVWFDTMVASYVLESDRSHGMDNMARDLLGYEPVSLKSLLGTGKHQLTFDMVDLEAGKDYAAEDADITWQLYEYFTKRLEEEPGLKKLFFEVEMPLVSVLARMEMEGVWLNVGLLKKMSLELSKELERLEEEIYQEAGCRFNIDSPKQLGEILYDRIGLKSVRRGKTMRSTDASVLESLKNEHAVPRLVLEYRQLIKLKNTYVDKLGHLIHPRTGRVHASFNQTVTATGRLSSSDPNLQNIPIRTELGKKIRGAFAAENDGDVILAADYSQIELRLLAHFSKDEALIRAFEEDQDIHRFVASQIYDVAPEEVTSEMRSKCKAVNFGIIYGQGPYGLSQTIGISQAEAKEFIADYFQRYASIRSFMDENLERAKGKGYAETILNRRRTIRGLDSRNHNTRRQAERMAINTTIQGSAADLIKVAMINIQRKIDKEYPDVRMLLQIHDELVFELPGDKADQYRKWISEEMTRAIALDVPLKVDVEIGRSWLGEEDV